MYLDQYIAILLEQHECVIVPEFGAFIANERPLYINESEGRIYPASKRLAFNPSLTFNDGLLINTVSFYEKVNYNDATELVKNELGKWRKKLSDKEPLLLLGIGELILNQDNKLIFTPLLNNNFQTEWFGLPELEVKPISRKSPELSSIEQEISYSIVDEQVVKPNRQHKLSKSKKVLYYSLTSYIPIIIGLWAVLYFADPFNKSNESSLNPVDNKIASSAQNKSISETATASSQEKNSFRSDNMNTASIVNIDSSPQTIFYVIGGSFKSYRNASILHQELLSKSYKSKIVKSSNNQYRVAYSAFSSRSDAESYLQSIRQTENSSAWILNESK